MKLLALKAFGGVLLFSRCTRSLSFSFSLSLSRFPKPSIGADRLNLRVARFTFEPAEFVLDELWLVPTEVAKDVGGAKVALRTGTGIPPAPTV